MRHRPELDLIAEAYAKVLECNECGGIAMPSMVLQVEPEDEGCPYAAQGCDCDGCSDCQDNQHNHSPEETENNSCSVELTKINKISSQLLDLLQGQYDVEDWMIIKIARATQCLADVFDALEPNSGSDIYNMGYENQTVEL